MEDKILFAALAGLLHDVGKFAQRATVGLSEVWDNQAQREYGYQHALASQTFLNKHTSESLRRELSGVAYHHHPKYQPDYWIQAADHLASAEREQDIYNRDSRLLSIFSSLGMHGKNLFIPLKRLDPSIKSNIFPVAAAGNPEKEYRLLWEEFEQACLHAELAKIEDPSLYLETIYSLLQDFTWCIPSAFWKTSPDISLFDHCRITSAIAACLAADERSIEWCSKIDGSTENVCLLVGGDLSGVQNFIYSISSSGAARSLRARSFYVQLITEAIALWVMRELKLPITNLVYVGGGGFLGLAPVNSSNALNKIATDLTNRLLDAHQGSLGLTLGWTEVKAYEFANISEARERLGKKINRSKRQPFSSASPEKLASIIGQPLTQGGDVLRFCSVTGEDGENIVLQDGAYKSKLVVSLEDLGRRLPKVNYLALQECSPVKPSVVVDWQQALALFGLHVQLDNQPFLNNNKSGQASFIRIWRLSPKPDQVSNEWLKSFGRIPKVMSYRPFARLTPLLNDGSPKTTDHLAEDSTGNFKRWGVLRMDLDNLGELFRTGFGENVSLSRVASLSFSLRLFFEGWLPFLAYPDQYDTDLSDRLYIQYAGGDDLFVIGAWDVLPEFALRIQKSLKQYTCENPKVTISGGICIVPAGFPIDQAAELAKDAEEKAKRWDVAGKRKNAITFMDVTLPWDRFAQVKLETEQLKKGIEEGGLPRSLLQTLLSLHASLSQARQEAMRNKLKTPRLGRWTWMAAYQLTRLSVETKKEEWKVYIQKLRDLFLMPNDITDQTGLAARWAQYLTRGG